MKQPETKVNLISYTGHGNPDPLYAARLLAFTKNTRLQMTPDGMSSFADKSDEWLLNELQYMASSIPSSWEFIELIFSIENVSRACAQQMTRTRTASFAMQSQRVSDMSQVTVHIPETLIDDLSAEFYGACEDSKMAYQDLVNKGATLEDARGVLPMNSHCNLIAKYNLRAFVDLMRSRESLRAQGEYRTIAAAMKAECLRVWPWSETFFQPKDAKAIAIIEELAAELPYPQMIRLAKAADLLKK